jgi:hypothetical protein
VLTPSGGGLILSQAYGNLFAMTGSERYFPFPYCDIDFITPERCEYLNTICEVLVYDLRACLWFLVERLFVQIYYGPSRVFGP